MEVEQEVPAEVAVTRFAAARALEIENLTAMLESSNCNKLIFQKLPKHMRRRAMSHNPNRLPRKLREAHIAQREKSGGNAETKRPSRKYRRRPSRLRDSYKERVKDKSWLETHIWHAKRFHMVTQWGYKLPYRSCEKGFRASYRAVSSHCLLQDVSYLCCLEITGNADLITRGFGEISNEKTGPMLKVGPREGSLVLYKQNAFPDGAIGTATYFWRPHRNSLAAQTLWLWVHPAFYDDVLHELNLVFGLGADDFQTGLRYVNQEAEVSLCSLKDSLTRLRLRGPLSKSVLNAAYEVKGAQLDCLEIPPRLVCGIRIRDPRLTLPVKRTAASSNSLATLTVDPGFLPQDLSIEDLWIPELRDSITKHRKDLPDLEINKRRQELLVPGSRLPIQPDEKEIPLILIHSSLGSAEEVGWDIVGPAGWATALWLPLVYNGARVGGLFDAEVLNYESNILPDVKLEPDMAAGVNYFKKKEEELMETYFKKPPKKRENFMKLGVLCPFNPDWSLLTSWWTSNSSFFVLRDRAVLHQLKALSQTSQEIKDFLKSHPCLVEVTVTLLSGTPEDHATIVWPLRCDSGSVLSMKGNDEKAKERAVLRKQHKEELAKLARKRKELKKQGSDPEKFKSEEISRNFNEKMRNLWLPTSQQEILKSSSRPIAGFVIWGGLSLKRGKGFGRGYVVGASLCDLTDAKVLVRNTNSLQFYWATLDIV